MSKILKALEANYKRYLALVILDKSGDSNRIVKMIGFVFMVLGILIISNKVIVTELGITSITLSGIFFILTDFSEFFILRIETKKAIDASIRYKKERKYIVLKIIFLSLAVLTLLIGPYINLKINSIFLNKVNKSLSLMAIGLTVFKIGIDNSMEQLNEKIQIVDEVNEICKKNQEHKTEKKENI